MALTVYGNNPSTTTGGSDGTSSPISGYGETWASTSFSAFPSANPSAVPPTQFHIADPAHPTELILVTNTSTGAVTRGAENTTPVAHSAGATFYQIISAGDLNAVKQASGAIVTPVDINHTATETVVCSYQPSAGEVVVGTTFELIATGSIQTANTATTLAFTLRWGGLGGTQICTMVTGTLCPALVTAITSGSSIDINGTVTFIDTTHCIGNINAWWQKTTTTYTGVVSNGTSITVSGSGPLVLTAKWGSGSYTTNSLLFPAPLTYRAA